MLARVFAITFNTYREAVRARILHGLVGLAVGTLGYALVVGAYALASVPENGDIPATVGPFLGLAVGLPLAAHVAVRRLAPQADGMLLPLASLLNGLGYVFIVRLDEARAKPQGLAGLQSLWMVVGVAAFVATLLFLRDTRTLERYRYTAGFVGLVLLLLPLLPVIGQTINGSRIWVSLGPVNFQPGEFAKLALAIFFAGYLVEKRELLAINRGFGPFSLPDPKHLGPILVAWAVALVVMIAEKDLGSSLLFFALFVALLWVSTERASYLVVGITLFLGGGYLAFSSFNHVQERFDGWLNPWESDKGGQVIQAAFAFADGGVFGTGLNLGMPVGRIPVVESDMIFAAIGVLTLLAIALAVAETALTRVTKAKAQALTDLELSQVAIQASASERQRCPPSPPRPVAAHWSSRSTGSTSAMRWTIPRWQGW